MPVVKTNYLPVMNVYLCKDNFTEPRRQIYFWQMRAASLFLVYSHLYCAYLPREILLYFFPEQGVWRAGGRLSCCHSQMLLSWMVQDVPHSYVWRVGRMDEGLGFLDLHMAGLDFCFGNWILNPKSECAKEEMKAASPHRPRTGRGSLPLYSVG